MRFLRTHATRARLSFSRLALGLGLLLGLSGCGEGFDPGSEVKTLRVLGVHKDKPYPRPGEDVNIGAVFRLAPVIALVPSVAELSAAVVSPAAQRGVLHSRARVGASRGDLRNACQSHDECRRCGQPIQSRKQGKDARTTFWCPICQPLHPMQTSKK